MLATFVRLCSASLRPEAGQLAGLHFCLPLGCPEAQQQDAPVPEAVGFAFNHVEKKKRLFKPKHTIQEQIAYMQSTAYKNSYKGLPIFHWYRRNIKGQAILQPPPRLHCLDKEGKFNVNNPCPVCRDEYLFFDYRNPALILQFLAAGTDRPLPILRTGLCFEQYHQLQAHLTKAKEHVWYPWWTGEKHVDVHRGKAGTSVQQLYPDPLVEFPVHKRDVNNDWDQWWLRHDEFAHKAR